MDRFERQEMMDKGMESQGVKGIIQPSRKSGQEHINRAKLYKQ